MQQMLPTKVYSASILELGLITLHAEHYNLLACTSLPCDHYTFAKIITLFHLDRMIEGSLFARGTACLA